MEELCPLLLDTFCGVAGELALLEEDDGVANFSQLVRHLHHDVVLQVLLQVADDCPAALLHAEDVEPATFDHVNSFLFLNVLLQVPLREVLMPFRFVLLRAYVQICDVLHAIEHFYESFISK